MLLTADHFGHVLDCIFHLVVGAVEWRRQSAWLRGFCELAQNLLASAHSVQRSAPSLRHRLSHCTYCKWCWFTVILKLLLQTELPHTVWLAHGSLRDWAKKGGWGWNCFEINPVYIQCSGMLHDGHGNGLCLQACKHIWKFCMARWQPRRIFICM